MPLKTHSVSIIDGRERADWVHCCHCQKAHPVRAAIDSHIRGVKVLGWCPKCSAPCCPTCEANCVPVEQMLSNIEAGLNPLAERPAFSFIPRRIEG
jgi:hypothetical protein